MHAHQPPLLNPFDTPGPEWSRRKVTAVVAGLFVLALGLRGLAAWQLEAITPDGLTYIRAAEALDRRDYASAFEDIGLNTYPVVLLALNRTGLSWQTAGEAWGVLIGSLVVFPLFGWLRRQLTTPMAAAGAFVYAIHPYFVEKSPELVRDPTFWFLWIVSLSLLWRCTSEGRIGLYAAAGVTMTLAAHTRIEGWLLFLPLVTWTLPRLRDADARIKQRFAGVLACAACVPAAWLMVNVVWLSDYAPLETGRLFRSDVIEYLHESIMAAPDEARTAAPELQPDRHRRWSSAGDYVDALARVFGPVFAILVACGACPSLFRRGGTWTMAMLAVLLLVGAALFQAALGRISSRYFATVALLAVPMSGAGLVRVLWVCRGLAVERLGVPSRTARGVAAAVLTVGLLATVCGKLLRPGHDARTAQARLGAALARQYGSRPVVVGPKDLSLVGFYAGARYHAVPSDARYKRYVNAARRVQADILLMPAAVCAGQRGALPGPVVLSWDEGERRLLVFDLRARTATAGRPPGR
ncbi:MAG TPA: glycosyltransferase family 39 protein [Planctomycetaceae bacterium]|nr:glycosyltransferase family 39 protein [Planctomycetaceae bacterium]